VRDNGTTNGVADPKTATGMVNITVTSVNDAPTVGTISWNVSVDPAKVNTAIVANATSFSDVDVIDTHTATWDWGDGSNSVGTVSESNGSGTVNS
jgi:hypothetical protein